jgi:biotin carboxyl carrier protein
VRVELEVGGRTRVIAVEARGGVVVALVEGRRVELEVARLGPGRYSFRSPATGRQHDVRVAAAAPNRHDVTVNGATLAVTRQVGAPGRPRDGGSGQGPARLVAPMPGKVVRVLVAVGDDVSARQGLVVVEAMKMENELRAGRAGHVREVLVAEGTSVEAGALLVVIE